MGEKNQNKELLDRILKAIIEIRAVKKDVQVEAYKKGVQLPDDNSLLETLWKRNEPGGENDKWDKENDKQKEVLKNFLSERLIGGNFDF